MISRTSRSVLGGKEDLRLEEEKECTGRRGDEDLRCQCLRLGVAWAEPSAAARPRGEEEENEMSRVSGLGLMFLYQARYMWALVDL
jgi:hypothetical protein